MLCLNNFNDCECFCFSFQPFLPVWLFSCNQFTDWRNVSLEHSLQQCIFWQMERPVIARLLMSTGSVSGRRSGSFQSQLQSSSIYLERIFLILVFHLHWKQVFRFPLVLRDKYIVPLPSGGIPPLQPFCIISTCWYIALCASYRVQTITSVCKNPLENS